MSNPIRLVVGLGNPGREYVDTRHNAGFWFADQLASRLRATFAHESKFAGEVARAGDVRIVKPSTFMNLSGRSVAALARFFDVAPVQILVVHDELDLRAGDVKMKFGGGHAGHNGLRDIQAQLASPDFWRLRIGIGHPRDSDLSQQQVVDYVLQRPDSGDRDGMDAAMGRALDAWSDIAAGEMERAMMALHTKKISDGNGPAPPARL